MLRESGHLFGEDVAPAAAGYAHVALEQGIDMAPGGLTYAIPLELEGLAVGERVRVPLGRGNRPVPGFVVEVSEETEQDPAALKFILERDRRKVSLPADLIELARWVAGYYCSPLGMVFASMLPAAVKRGTGTVRETLVRLAEEADPDDAPAPPDDAEDEPAPRRGRKKKAKITPLQQAVLDAARRRARQGRAWVGIRHLADLAGAKTTSPIKQLMEKGLLVTRQSETVASDLDLRAQEAAEHTGRITLSPGQQEALDHLGKHLTDGFGVHLLHGVTGSGKTEVYLRLIDKALGGESGRVAEWPSGQAEETGGEAAHSATSAPAPAAIVLVPEIALTPQTVARFLARFGSVAVLHSGLTAAQRHAQWRRIREGKARIVIGARSAIFAPVQKLGLIIVDEEHESSYKQDQLPRYHARDVAIRRAQMRGVPVVLGSATPSLESYRNAVRAKEEAASGAQASQSVFHLVRMPERVPGMKLPDVEIVDLQEERRQRRGIHLLSQRMEAELKRIVCGPSGDGAAQALLLLNRRGYANYIACPDHRCGWMMRCEYCDVTMVYHKDGRLPTGGLVRCHHCQAEQLLPSVCEVCGKKVTVFGLGTQRVAEELERKFPGIKAIRMDADTMRSARDYRETLDRFRRGEAHVLLGTQMIAKGLDFPSVRLVGVISGDTALHLPDFRAAERTFQLISQVAGRAGRSSEVGRVIVQSFSPEDPAIVLASKHDYEGFAARELAFRQEVGLPPATRMVRIVIRDPDPYGCIQRARELAEHLTRFDQQLGTQIRITGPMPCPIARIAGFHRQEIKLVAPSAGPLQRLLTAARNIRLLTSDARTAVDVDPVSLL